MERIIFYILALMMIVMAIASVSSRKMLRSVIYLLFVLAGVAGIFFLIDYNFLIRIEEDNIESIEKRIKDYKQKYNLSEMSVKCRSVWENWFAPKKIGKFLIKTLNKIC